MIFYIQLYKKNQEAHNYSKVYLFVLFYRSMNQNINKYLYDIEFRHLL